MGSRKVVLILGAFALAAVLRALVDVIGGESPTRAILGGVLFALLFVPVFFFLMRAIDRRRRKSLGLSGDSTLTTSNEPIRVSETVSAPGSVDEVAHAVERQIVVLNGRPERTTGSAGELEVTAGIGSRLALRLLGTSLAAGRRRMPMKLRVHVRRTGADGAVATIEACSDEGWYLVRPSSFEAEYRRALDAVVAQVREAVGGYSPARD